MDSILSQWFQSLTKYDDGNLITSPPRSVIDVRAHI
jgi:hypothetical protein